MTTETKIELGAAQPPVKAKAKGKKRGRPTKSRTQRIRELNAAGFTPKQIAAKTGAPVQQVYVVRYTEKQKELASKGAAAQVETQQRKLRTISMVKELGASFEPAPVKIEGAQIPYNTVTVIAPQQPKPTFWQRVKAVFFPQ